MSGKILSIEISYGSIIDFGMKTQLHEASMGPSGTRVPRNFSRMILSNVADYVGLISTFVSLTTTTWSASFDFRGTTSIHCRSVPFDVQILPFDWVSNPLDHDGAGSIAHDNSKEAADVESKNC